MHDLLPGLTTIEDLHPMFVHLPIGLWIGALVLWAVGLTPRSGRVWDAGRWVLYLASLAAVASAATGLWAADRLGRDSPGHDLVHVHRNFMLVATGLGAATPKPQTTAVLVYVHGMGTRMEAAGNMHEHGEEEHYAERGEGHQAHEHGDHTH